MKANLLIEESLFDWHPVIQRYMVCSDIMIYMQKGWEDHC